MNSDHPMQAFTQGVRSRPELFSQWHHQRVEKVAEYIRSFFARNGIEAQVTVPYDPVARTSGFSPGIRAMLGATSPPMACGGLPDSASVVHQIDDVIKSLLKLRGTIGFLESSQKDG